MNVHVQPLGQPTPGSARPGNLYADLQSRSLWLGVDLAVDPSGSVLISDMLSLMDDIAAAEGNANAYTDDQLTAYARIADPIFTGNPRAPTPLAADNDTSLATTAFVKSAIAVGVPGAKFLRGMIMMWSGPTTSIGVGELAGWALCDGGNGTPNLTDKFILGAGGGAEPLDTNPLAEFSTDIQGSHVHTINGYTLKLADIPKHNHGFGTLAGTISGSGTAASAGTHSHNIGGAANVPDEGGWSYRNAGNTSSVVSASGGAHTHPVTVSGTCDINSGATALNTSGDGSHTHTMIDNGSHQHKVTSQQVRDVTPWLALAYIMKL